MVNRWRRGVERRRALAKMAEWRAARAATVRRSDRLLRSARSASRALRNAFTHYVSGAAGREASLSKFRGH